MLKEQITNIQRKFKKSKEEVVDLFISASGDTKKMRAYYEKKPVVLWNMLEDLALTKPDDSLEFSVLLQEKGWHEICLRRIFLKANP